MDWIVLLKRYTGVSIPGTCKLIWTHIGLYWCDHSFYLFFMAVLGLGCCTWVFSSCGVWASHCSGFLCCRARALGTWPLEIWRAGLAAPWHMGSSQPGIEPASLALEGRFLTTGSPGKWYYLGLDEVTWVRVGSKSSDWSPYKKGKKSQ